MKIELELQVPDATGDIFDLKEFIQDYNISGLKIKEKYTPIKEGIMGGGELQPILELLLSPAVSIAIVSCLFKIIKDFMDLRKYKISKQAEAQKIVFTKTDKKGTIEKIEMTFFTEKERTKFIDFFINKNL